MNHIKKIVLLFFSYLSLGMNSSFAAKVTIIPEPVKMEIYDGTFTIGANTRIYFDSKNPLLARHARYFTNVVASVSDVTLKTSKNRAQSQVRLLIAADKLIGDEGYHLDIDEKGITISASTDKGVFYGLQSLLQLLPVYRTNAELQLPLLKITDYPRFKWRGMMLDVSRHFFSTEAVKSYIDLMAMYKMNVFHWHLTDSEGWRLEIKKYPKLTSVGAWRKEIPGSVFYKKNQVLPIDTFSYGGFYTQEQAKDIVKYAGERNIMVVPEIEMPGHSDAAITAYPELSCTGMPQQVRSSFGGDPNALANYCAGKEDSFVFLENVLKEVMTIFPGDYIHIGGDEVNKASWKKCASCQRRMVKEGLKDEHELQSYFIKRMANFLHDKDKKLIGWDEILEGGLAAEATVMSWRGEQGGIQAAKMHHPVVMTPVNPLYFNRYQADTLSIQQPLAARYSINTLEKVYDYEPIPGALNAVEASFVLGAQGCIWTEFINSVPHLEQMALPRMLALSEVLWSPKTSKDWSRFNEKLYFHSRRLGSVGRNVFTSVPFLYHNTEVK
ncbi:beta-N-acetylhexosaminidase [Pedobacter sp. N36a]|uniref:beta-N-acetylhexosaminidase n=1 Tax=Pedobacter sp. N36a TaxID=2767996 RepID=UPI00165710C5|nr:beta-N-acetylhexosaminidase [Pedobacter sp. N36a]MBC8988001.1 beta-N-acetylhexosaminidase [Pedobacter sp. N36a]